MDIKLIPSVVLLLILMPAIGLSDVQNQDEPVENERTPEDAEQVAKTFFQNGVSFFTVGEYAEALNAFEASYKVLPKPTVLFNIGMCQKELYYFAEAIASFETLLATPEGVHPSILDAAARSLKEVRERRCLLNILGAPDGTELHLGDKVIAVLPAKDGVTINPGDHTLRLVKEGYVTFEAVVSLSPSEQAELAVEMHEIAKPKPEVIIQTREPDPSWFVKNRFWIGMGSLGVGLTTGVLGLVFNKKTLDAKEVGEDAGSRIAEIDSTSPWTNEMEQERNSLVDDINSSRSDFNKYRAATVVMYSVGGALMITGAVLLGIGRRDKKKESDPSPITVAPSPGGIVVNF